MRIGEHVDIGTNFTRARKSDTSLGYVRMGVGNLYRLRIPTCAELFGLGEEQYRRRQETPRILVEYPTVSV